MRIQLFVLKKHPSHLFFIVFVSWAVKFTVLILRTESWSLRLNFHNLINSLKHLFSAEVSDSIFNTNTIQSILQKGRSSESLTSISSLLRKARDEVFQRIIGKALTFDSLYTHILKQRLIPH